MRCWKESYCYSILSGCLHKICSVPSTTGSYIHSRSIVIFMIQLIYLTTERWKMKQSSKFEMKQYICEKGHVVQVVDLPNGRGSYSTSKSNWNSNVFLHYSKMVIMWLHNWILFKADEEAKFSNVPVTSLYLTITKGSILRNQMELI